MNSNAPSSAKPAMLIANDAELKPIKISSNNSQVLKRGAKIMIAGRGKETFHGFNTSLGLQMAEMELYFIDTHGKRLIMSDDQSSACPGDSGGPNYLFQNNKLILIGVTSTATCDLNYNNIEINGSFPTIKLFNTGSTDLRKFNTWIKQSLTGSELSSIKEYSNIEHQSPNEVRPTDETIGIVNNFTEIFSTSSDQSSATSTCIKPCHFPLNPIEPCESPCVADSAGCLNFKISCK